MPLPDPYATEPVVELDPTKVKRWVEARENAEAWQKIADQLKSELMAEIGDAHAGKVGDEKVITYRPSAKYAEARLRKDHADLAQHFMRDRLETYFDMDAFAKRHPDIAAQYQVRQFRQVTE
jgi:hypothetical protein